MRVPNPQPDNGPIRFPKNNEPTRSLTKQQACQIPKPTKLTYEILNQTTSLANPQPNNEPPHLHMMNPRSPVTKTTTEHRATKSPIKYEPLHPRRSITKSVTREPSRPTIAVGNTCKEAITLMNKRKITITRQLHSLMGFVMYNLFTNALQRLIVKNDSAAARTKRVI